MKNLKSIYNFILKAGLISMSVAFCFFTTEGFATNTPKARITNNTSTKGKTKSSSKKNKKTNTPDFSMPRDVEKKAESDLTQALKNGKPVKTLRAAIDLDISRNLVSRENTTQNLALFDSLSKVLPVPYKAIAILLEADLYNDIYMSDNWTYDNRKLPADFNNPDPQTWSGTLFKNKIRSLLKEIPEASKGSEKLPISTISPIIDYYRNKKGVINMIDMAITGKEGFTVYDFIVYQMLDFLDTEREKSNVLPFYPVDNTRNVGCSSSYNLPSRSELIDSLINLHVRTKGLPLATAIKSKANEQTGDSKKNFLKESYHKYYPSDASALILLEIYNLYYNGSAIEPIPYTEDFDRDSGETTSKKIDILPSFPEMYNLLTDNSKLSDINPVIKEQLSTAASQLLIPNLSLNVPYLSIPGVPLLAKAKVQNLNSYRIEVYSIPYSIVDDAKASVIESKGVKVLSKIKEIDGSKPFATTDSTEIILSKPGYYAVMLKANDPAYSLNKSYREYGIINVSDITLTEITDSKSGSTEVYVRNAVTGAPIKDAKVKFQTGSRKGIDSKTLISDSEGQTISPFPSFKAIATYNGSTCEIYGNTWKNTSSDDKDRRCSILTDLSVYHPGDKVSFSAIVYEQTRTRGNVLPDIHVSILLRNANFERIDTLHLKTDKFGRVSGSFTIPETGLLGQWAIEEQVSMNATGFQVADYKAPSFFATVERSNSTKDFAIFNGVVKTYSGMPVQNATVDYTVNYSPWWWRRCSTSPASYGASIETDEAGKFQIELPLDNIMKSPYQYGSFILKATVTDGAGETVESNPVSFTLKDSYYLSADIPNIVKLPDDELKLSVKAFDAICCPVEKTVIYKIKSADGQTSLTGEFLSPILSLPTSSLNSGKYFLTFSLLGEQDSQPIKQEVVLYRTYDKNPPYTTPLWVPEDRLIADSESEWTEIPIGTSYSDHPILSLITDSKGNIIKEWITDKDSNFKIKVKNPASDERVRILLSAIDSLQNYNSTIEVIPSEAVKELKLSPITFRDKLTPGNSERWSFRLSCDSLPMGNMPVMAVMSNKSIDAIAPFNWHLKLLYTSYPDYFSLRGVSSWNSTIGLTWKAPLLNLNFYPQFNWRTYNYGLYSRDYRYYSVESPMLYSAASADMVESDDAYDSVTSVKEMKVSSRSSATATNGAIKIRGSRKEEAITEEQQDAGEEYGNNEDLQLRPVDIPLALFSPNLITDKDGDVIIDFEVPDFNTEWKLQLAAYTPDLLTTTATYYATASKPVMVKMQNPVFLNTGNDILLKATLYNNTETTLAISGKWEIYDPTDNRIIASLNSETSSVSPSGNMIFTIPFSVPDNITSLGLRCYAISEEGRDGEQTVIPVLPSSKPVIESETFYLSPTQTDFKTNIGEIVSNANITLQYCDNSVWNVLTALPSISEPKNVTISSQIAAFYANNVGYGLIKNNPNLHKGLSMIVNGEAGDSMLTSNLEKNQSLKTVFLTNTPWVNNAKSETLRLSRLSDLLDNDKAMKAIDTNLKNIIKLRNSDGGFSWCPGMSSSLWATKTVLINFGLLRHGGYLNEDTAVKAILKDAIRYCDAEEVNSYKKWNRSSDYPYYTLLNYLYTRSFFNQEGISSSFAELKRKAVNAIESDWKRKDIFDKATIAILMWREGRKQLSLEILESLRQYASYSEAEGMWFDNLESGYMGAGKLLTTARVMSAFSEIRPDDDAIIKLRQWMILQRQAQDWQEGLFSVDAIDAVLTSGPSASITRSTPIIKVGKREIPVDEVSKLTGSVTVEIPSEELRGDKITILREGGEPAWGGIIQQYVAPVNEVKAVSIPEISIEKKLYRIINDDNGETVEYTETFRPGDKVRVTLVINTTRDMDYIAVTDMRPACFRAVNQLSGYSMSDGLWRYQETRTDSTNIFFSFLPKGRHIITYDCFVNQEGTFDSGIATLQCQYAPMLTAHSSGAIITVK